MPNTILVATDGAAGALGALRLASRLSEREGCRVEVLTVLEPADLYAVGATDALASPQTFLAEPVDVLRDRVRAQLAQVGHPCTNWPVSVEVGRVAPTVARAAARLHATRILVGLRQPGAVERWLARETLLRLIHLAHVPVLAVAEAARGLPRQAVVAVDFSDFSRRAAEDLTRLLAEDARLHLAHVSWIPGWEVGRPADPASWTEWERSYRVGVERRLEEFAAQLRLPGRAAIETHLLTGDPGQEVLRLAERQGADLIAAGSHGSGFFGRIVLGSVSGTLVHGAHCSLLIAPPQAVPGELQLELSERELLTDLGRAGEWTLSEPARGGEAQ